MKWIAGMEVGKCKREMGYGDGVAKVVKGERGIHCGVKRSS